ncbi:MAG: T9SS type A sorting domain-containing protein [Bacteroidota bacterium]
MISNNNQCYAVFTYEVDVSVGIVDPTIDVARIYPNPATDRVTIELDGLQAGVSLHDLTGREIAVPQTRQQGQTTLSLGAISAGVYLVRIHGQDQQRVMRLVKQ